MEWSWPEKDPDGRYIQIFRGLRGRGLGGGGAWRGRWGPLLSTIPSKKSQDWDSLYHYSTGSQHELNA